MVLLASGCAVRPSALRSEAAASPAPASEHDGAYADHWAEEEVKALLWDPPQMRLA